MVCLEGINRVRWNPYYRQRRSRPCTKRKDGAPIVSELETAKNQKRGPPVLRLSGRSEELEVKIDLSNENQFAYRNLLLWLLGGVIVGVFFDELLNRLTDRTQVMILVVAIVVIWYSIDFPKKTTNSGVTLLFWLPLALGLFCGVMWKISGEDIWVRIGIACICVRAIYRVCPLPEARNRVGAD